jgi:hypothetical protein
MRAFRRSFTALLDSKLFALSGSPVGEFSLSRQLIQFYGRPDKGNFASVFALSGSPVGEFSLSRQQIQFCGRPDKGNFASVFALSGSPVGEFSLSNLNQGQIKALYSTHISLPP